MSNQRFQRAIPLDGSASARCLRLTGLAGHLWLQRAAAVIVLAASCFAQSPDAAAQAPSTQQGPQANTKPAAPQTTEPKQKDESKPGANSGTSNDRLFYTLPNFLTLEQGAQIKPLTAKEKYKVVARSSFDYVQLPWYGFLAGVSQAVDSEKGFGQGASGYGKRFAAYAADGTLENFMVGAVLPSALHQDPRFFQLGRGGFWHRTGYALSRIVVTRGDSGHTQFNFSEVLGSGAASAISNYSYHPQEDHTASNTMSVWATQMGYDALTLVVKEFWPDIRRKMQKHPKPAPTQPAP
jgi:hypothetical protein